MSYPRTYQRTDRLSNKTYGVACTQLEIPIHRRTQQQGYTIRAAFADWEKNRKILVSGDGSRGGGVSRSGGESKGGGDTGGGDNGGGVGQSPYPLQAFCNSSISRCLETHFFRKCIPDDGL